MAANSLQIEETLKRIQTATNVEGYIISDEVGNVLRTTYTDEGEKDLVAKLSADLPALAERASSAVRDLDPTNVMRFVRVQTRKKELMISKDTGFVLMVVQGSVKAE